MSDKIWQYPIKYRQTSCNIQSNMYLLSNRYHFRQSYCIVCVGIYTSAPEVHHNGIVIKQSILQLLGVVYTSKVSLHD